MDVSRPNLEFDRLDLFGGWIEPHPQQALPTDPERTAVFDNNGHNLAPAQHEPDARSHLEALGAVCHVQNISPGWTANHGHEVIEHGPVEGASQGGTCGPEPTDGSELERWANRMPVLVSDGVAPRAASISSRRSLAALVQF